MRIRVDRQADAAYIQLRDAPVHQTVELNDRTYLDVDERGDVIGVEILEAGAFFERDQIDLTVPENIREIGQNSLAG